MKLLNYIEENNQNQEDNEMEGGQYDGMLTKNTKTNENLTSEDLALHGITKENYINEKNTENFEDEHSKSIHISKISEVSDENSAQKHQNKKGPNAVKQNQGNKGAHGKGNQKGNSDRNNNMNKSNSQSKIQ